MNTIVFVLVMVTHSNYAVPTLEFKTLEKCEMALKQIDQSYSGSPVVVSSKSKCIRIEK
jgi:hypothetical protein